MFEEARMSSPMLGVIGSTHRLAADDEWNSLSTDHRQLLPQLPDEVSVPSPHIMAQMARRETRRVRKRLDAIAFAIAVSALVSFLLWVFLTAPI